MSKPAFRLNESGLIVPGRLSRREFLIGSATVAGGIALAACSTSPAGSGGSSPAPSDKKYTLVFIAGIDGVPFYQRIQKGADSMAKSKGATLTYAAAPNWDPNLQTQLVNSYIAKKVDAIIIAPTDNKAMIAPLKSAYDKGIQVVTVDTFLGTGDYATDQDVKWPLAYIGSDNVKGGKIAGEALIKAIGGSGKVYLQNNAPGASTAVQRAQGFKDAITATNGAVQLVAENFDGGDINKATAQTSAILQAHPDIVGIFGATAFSAEGAAAAVKNAHKSGVIKVAHFDSSQQSIIDLRNGIVDLIIGQKPFDMGSISVDYAIKALSGNGKDLAKHVATDFIVIDKNNVDTPEAQNAVY